MAVDPNMATDPNTPMIVKDSLTLTIGLGVAVWGALNVGFTVAKMVNERRDAVIIGKIDKVDLSVEHKQLILRADWLPMIFVAVLLSLLTIALAGLVPQVTPTGWFTEFWKNVWQSVLAIIFIAAAFGWGILGTMEYELLKQCAAKHPPAAQPDTACPACLALLKEAK
ncbi:MULTISPECIES: hypothetical protein [Bradyrhizobium]|uniref:hypothetical protein n=1 Tax=Bradyrhizobium TaxID=374 RepID=UPI001EDC332D|nr:hypothetical protein [Bradyrhizobium zhengyangense]MCG2637548.1 hypothetical protein [Bradyrhizobium zhengyangense]